MKEYKCPKCNSVDLFLQAQGNQTGLYCGDCGAWIKWIGKKEMPLVKRYMESNKGIEFTVEENSKEKENNNGLEDTFQIRIYQYNGGKVGYYDVDKKAIPKILDIIEKHKKI